MREKIQGAFCKIGRVLKGMYDFFGETFHFGFALKRRRDPEHPLLEVKVSGSVPEEVKRFFTLLGVLTAALIVLKILFRIH